MKDLDLTSTAKEAATSMPSQRHVVSSTVHDIHHNKEPPSMIILSHSH